MYVSKSIENACHGTNIYEVNILFTDKNKLLVRCPHKTHIVHKPIIVKKI